MKLGTKMYRATVVQQLTKYSFESINNKNYLNSIKLSFMIFMASPKKKKKDIIYLILRSNFFFIFHSNVIIYFFV